MLLCPIPLYLGRASESFWAWWVGRRLRSAHDPLQRQVSSKVLFIQVVDENGTEHNKEKLEEGAASPLLGCLVLSSIPLILAMWKRGGVQKTACRDGHSVLPVPSW